MNIDLSPGEWAYVMEAVIERAEREDDRELSDDAMRVAGIIRAALAAPALPELVSEDSVAAYVKGLDAATLHPRDGD